MFYLNSYPSIHFESQISKSNNNKNEARRVKFQKQETDAELKLKTFRDEYVTNPSQPRHIFNTVPRYLKEPLQLYSEFSCLLLITRMHDRLPRELRDLIYAHIWTPSYLRKNCTPIVTAFQGIQGYGDVHVLDADFVGVEIGREILEALYKADPMPIQPFSAYNPYDVERLMLNDIFGLYVEPAKMLRKMDIELDLHDLTFQTPKHGDVGFMEMNEIKECLHTLLEVEKKRKFKLSIKLKQRRVRLNDCPRWFDVLKPILEAFEKEGADVKIIWSYTGTEWAEHKVRKPLNNLIKSHPNNPDWKTTVIQELDMVRLDLFILFHAFIRSNLCSCLRNIVYETAIGSILKRTL